MRRRRAGRAGCRRHVDARPGVSARRARSCAIATTSSWSPTRSSPATAARVRCGRASTRASCPICSAPRRASRAGCCRWPRRSRRERVFGGFLGGRERAFYYGHSFCGNPLGAAVALEVLRVYEEERVLERARPKAARIADAFSKLGALPGVARTRALGMVGALDLAGDEGYLADAGWRVYEEARRRGAYLRPLGNVIYVAPPLNIADADLDALLGDRLRERRRRAPRGRTRSRMKTPLPGVAVAAAPRRSPERRARWKELRRQGRVLRRPAARAPEGAAGRAGPEPVVRLRDHATARRSREDHRGRSRPRRHPCGLRAHLRRSGSRRRDRARDAGTRGLDRRRCAQPIRFPSSSTTRS